MMCLFSIVVCTHNRADDLRVALDTLCRQRFDPARYEVLVVDNNSTDETRAVTEAVRRRCPNVYYLFEAAQGLSHARNRGWRAARGQYVAYTDDDCKLPPQWLAVAWQIIQEHAPAVFGGPYFAFYRVPPVHWYKDRYGSFVHARKAGALQPGMYLSGGNMFIRRDILVQTGGFSSALGMTGQKIAYGEETALLQQLRHRQPDELIYYDPCLFVFHLVPAYKMRPVWIIRQAFARGRYTNRIRWPEATHTERQHPLLWQTAMVLLAVLIVLYCCLDVLLRLVWRNRRQYPAIENYIYEQTCLYVRRLGALYERFWRVRAATQ